MALTVEQAIDRATILYDVAGSTVLNDAEWLQLLNDAYNSLWDTVVEINPRWRSTPLRFTLTGQAERVIASSPADSTVSNQLIMANAAWSPADVGSVVTTFWTGANANANRSLRISAYLSATTVETTPSPPTTSLPKAGYAVLEGSCVALPVDFRDVYLVKADPGTESEVILNRYPPRIAQTNWERSYDVRDKKLYIEPFRRSAGNFEVLYTPNPMELSDDDDEIDFELDRFKAYLVYHMANVALTREEGARLYDAEFVLERERVIRWAKNQRSAEPDTVEDVRRQTVWRRGWAP